MMLDIDRIVGKPEKMKKPNEYTNILIKQKTKDRLQLFRAKVLMEQKKHLASMDKTINYILNQIEGDDKDENA